MRLQQKYMTSLSATLIHEIVESLYVQNSLSKGVTESSDLKRLRSYAARTGELLQSHSGDLGVYMNGHVARICAAVSTFAEISQNKELKQLWLELYQPLKKSKAFESEYIRYQAAFKQFADARKDGLRASYDPAFDAYKMFSLPAQRGAVTGKQMRMIRPIKIGRL